MKLNVEDFARHADLRSPYSCVRESVFCPWFGHCIVVVMIMTMLPCDMALAQESVKNKKAVKQHAGESPQIRCPDQSTGGQAKERTCNTGSHNDILCRWRRAEN